MSGAEYPRQLYHHDGRSTRAESAEEEGELSKQGWGREAIAGVSDRSRSASAIVPSGQDPMAALIREVLESVLDDRGVGASRVERAERAKQARQPKDQPPSSALRKALDAAQPREQPRRRQHEDE